MKTKKILAYTCVTIIMFFVGFALFGALGFVGGYTIAWSNQVTGGPANDLVLAGWSMAALLAPIGGFMLALSVYVKNPLAVVLDRIEQALSSESGGNKAYGVQGEPVTCNPCQSDYLETKPSQTQTSIDNSKNSSEVKQP